MRPKHYGYWYFFFIFRFSAGSAEQQHSLGVCKAHSLHIFPCHRLRSSIFRCQQHAVCQEKNSIKNLNDDGDDAQTDAALVDFESDVITAACLI